MTRLPGDRVAGGSARVRCLLVALATLLTLVGCSSAPDEPESREPEPISSSQSQAISATLTAVDDSYIVSSNTSNTTGGSPYLFIGQRSTRVYRTLLKFNLASIPDGATVSSATLTLRAVTPSSMGTNNPTNPSVRVYPVSVSWTEDTSRGSAPAGGGQAIGVACAGTVGVTWLRRNCSSNTWTTAGGVYGAQIASASVGTGTGDVTFNVQSYVQSIADGTTDNGLILRASNEGVDNVRLFEANGSSNPPSLAVVYTRQNGDSCTGDTQCTSGRCVDVNGLDCATGGGGGCVCCTAATCSGACQSCHLSGSVGTCTNRPSSTECRPAAGTCDAAEFCTGSSSSCPADAKLNSSTECRASAGACDSPEFCTGSSNSCPSDTKYGSSTTCRAASGACDVAEVCSGSSNTCPADGVASNGTVCRADSGGGCDVAETCNGSSKSCPSDGYQTSGTVCRGASGTCDNAETCSGSSPNCPADGYKSAGTVCRADSGAGCDVAETCSGSSPACPTDAFKTSGTVCRADSGGGCDVAETCSGSSASCPSDGYQPSGTTCRAAAGVCDTAETCTGSSGNCPGNSFKNSSTVCRAANGACDVAENCTGSSASCPSDGYASSSTVCRAQAGVCDVEETCTGTGTSCPGDTKVGNGTVCRTAAGICDLAESCNGVSNDCPSDAKVTAGTTCRTAAGVCDAVETCNGTSDTCPSDGYQSSSTSCRSASCDATPPATATLAANCTGSGVNCPAVQTQECAGTCAGNVCGDCTQDSQCQSGEFCSGGACVPKQANGADCSGANACTSGFCVDGKCCNSACSGGTSDCQSCAVAGSAGTCTPIPNGTVCRSAAGVCDAVETCNGVATSCPSDAKLGTSSECRASGGSCDPAEFCSGSSNSCPSDARSPLGTICRTAAGTCDEVEACDGTSVACPTDVKKPASTVCRSSAGSCDIAENCSGSSDNCPNDSFVAGGTTCRAAGGVCDVAEACSGSSAACPADAKQPSSFVCRAAGGVCDVPENCNGSSNACPTDAKLPSTTVCRTAAGVCDVAENCTGSTDACPSDAKRSTSTVCRPSAGVCDVAENCTGGDNCPSDGFAPSSQSCRSASCTTGTGTLAASCTGSDAPCPALQTVTCDPYICDGTACGTVCSTDTECTLDHYCSGTVCTPKSPNGEPCSAANQCTSGICADGFCCNSACTGQCEACDVVSQEGACVATTGAPHGARAACDTDGTVCGGTCDGSNRAGCLYPGSATLCRAPSCTSNVATLPASCQGDGTCPAEQLQDCSPFVCGPTACVGNCTADVQCQSGAQYCSAGICVNKKANGEVCAAANQCSSGLCVDGVCCDSACTGQCEACSVSGSEGTCSAVSGAPVGGRAPCQSDGSACGGTCDGTDRQACVYPGFGVQCRGESCSNAVATLSASCNGAGACPPAIQQSCAPGACSGDRCDGGRLVDSHCNVGEFCAAGVCQAQKANGATCSAAGQCVSGNCVDGYCCNSACTGQCEACDASGSEGACSPIAGSPHGTRQACTSDGSACGGFCDGTNAAACRYAGSTTVCRGASCDDNVATVEATCQGDGRCPTLEQQACPPPNTCSGEICGGGCTTSADCQSDQYCAGGVCVAKKAQGATCTNDGACASGFCVDGVCCDTACAGQCEACDAVGAVGTCSLVSGQPHGGRTACLGSGACGAVCDGTSVSCLFPGGTTECGLGSCAAGVSIDAPVCNGAGTCLAPTATDCSPYLCDGDGCSTSCATSDDCADGFECQGSACVVPQVDAGPDAGTGGSGGQAGSGGTSGGSGGSAGVQSTGGAAGLQDGGLDAGVDAGVQFRLPDEDGACGCRVPGDRSTGAPSALWLGLGWVLWVTQRRRRAAARG